MLDKFSEKLATEIGRRIADFTAALLEKSLNKYFQKQISITFTEREAADHLKISAETLRKIRERGEINYSYFAKRPVYTIANIADYLHRHRVESAPPIYKIVREISPLGVEITETKSKTAHEVKAR